MECPACHADIQPAQKFCGACGYRMEKECAECGASNPPAYNFCTQCGHNLGTSGTIALVRSGLIAKADSRASLLLGHISDEMAGKPFSLFVTREDLAIFFSHWNDLVNSHEKQVLELGLNHKKGKKVYVLMECTYEERPQAQGHLIHLNLNDISDRRLALDQLQSQQDLLNLIFTLADKVRTVSGRHLDSAIVDALKKICLFTKADRSFIYGINRHAKRLEISQQWSQPSGSGGGAKSKSVPLSMVKRSIVRLLQKRSYVVNNVARLMPSERYELLAWHHTDLGALMCHLIYAGKRPVGIIGVAKCRADGEWSADCIALVKLFGQIVGDLLPYAQEQDNHASIETDDSPKSRHADATRRLGPNGLKPLSQKATSAAAQLENHKPRQAGDSSGLNPAAIAPRALPDPGKPMQLENHIGEPALNQQTVLARDDGLIVLTCPHCGQQESVTLSQFEKFGNAVDVQCACPRRFTAVLEKRRAYRKSVLLEGFFTISGDYGPDDTKGSIWGPMVVKNISKTGLRFHSKRVDLVRPGDLLMVRFNLDNTNKALIHKQVEVISIRDQEVGCRFKGADRFDITLGFYFI